LIAVTRRAGASAAGWGIVVFQAFHDHAQALAGRNTSPRELFRQLSSLDVIQNLPHAQSMALPQPIFRIVMAGRLSRPSINAASETEREER